MLEGKIIFDITCTPKAESANDVRVQMSLPQEIAHSFAGLKADVVLQRVTLLFSVCGAAQGYVAVQNLETLLLDQNDFSLERSRARALIAQGEKAKEYVLRVAMELASMTKDQSHMRLAAGCVNWRRTLSVATFGQNEPFDLGAAVQVNREDCRLDIQDIESHLQQNVFGQGLRDWMGMNTVEDLMCWVYESDALAARLLRILVDKEWQKLGDHPVEGLHDHELADFGTKMLNGDFSVGLESAGSQETGAMARYKDHPLIRSTADVYGYSVLTRYLSRLMDLATIPTSLYAILDGEAAGDNDLCVTQKIDENRAVSWLETARGRLYHAVTVSGDSVQNYKIISPTQWNFHSHSIAAKNLQGLQSGSCEVTFKDQAECIIRAIDPCVAFEVRVQ